MSPEAQHAALRAAFEAIEGLPDAEREPALAAMALDPALQAQALRLARASDAHTSRATHLARRLQGLAEEAGGPEVAAGDSLGAWRVVRPIGTGGMGAVFLAERHDGHFQQSAALKVLAGLASPAALTLLARERQILATLSHPNIARLLDGGATPRGRPYLVMEYIEGVPLDEHARGLAPAAVVRLMIQVCEAVAFAHARLVVHCDLKPSNILVDANGRPMLLDFGIARLLGHGLNSEASADTRAAFTPRYASPELRAGEAVGTEADVYSLGLILAELLERHLDRDLRAIAQMASAAEPSKRYASAALLALDLQRWLERRTVAARAPTLAYRGQMLLRRRWPAILASALFLATIAGFTARVLSERDRALLAEQRALREASTAQAVSQFLQELFRGADLDSGAARDTRALDLVERGRERVEAELKGQPSVQADLLGALARVYASLGEPSAAESSLLRGIALERSLPQPRSQRLASLLADYAQLLVERNRHAEAAAFAAEALELADRLPAEQARTRAEALAAAAQVATGRMQFDQADALLARLLQERERLGERGDALADTWYAIGQNAMERGDNLRAEREFERAAQAAERRFGAQHPRTLSARESLAVALGRQERLDEAEALLRAVLADRIALHGPRSSKVASVQTELAYLLTQQGDYIESAAFNEAVLAHQGEVEGEQSPVYARTLNNLAFAYQNMGDAERCVAAFQRSLDIRIATLPAGDLAIARAQNNLARFLMWLGRTDEARPLVDASLAIRSGALPEDQEERIESLISATEWARRAGQLERARALWGQIEPFLPRLHPYTQLEAQRTLAWLSVSERRPDARDQIERYIDGLRKELGAQHPSILRGRVAEMEMLEALGAQADARRLAIELQADFRARPRSYPAHSVFHARVARVAGG